jgi:hypothetical protein
MEHWNLSTWGIHGAPNSRMNLAIHALHLPAMEHGSRIVEYAAASQFREANDTGDSAAGERSKNGG